MRDGLAEIWTSATLGVDRGRVRISAKAKVRPLLSTEAVRYGTELSRTL